MGKHAVHEDPSPAPVAGSGSAPSEAIEIEYEAPRERHSTRKALVALGIVLVFLIAIVAGGVAMVNAKLAQVKTLANPFADITSLNGVGARPDHSNDDTPPITFLVLGSDSRISAGDPSQWQAGAQRTDAFMIVQLAGDRQSVNAMSIPRDSWVQIPGYGMAKINAAFSYGGPALTIATVEQLTGIRVDHIAVVDFTSFAALTDALGGVEMTSVWDGTRTYNGQEALAFVRERKHLPGGDFDRVRRQQLWMQTVLKKTLTRETLTNPGTMLNLYNTVSPYIAMDDQLTIQEVISLATGVKDIRADDFNFVTAPFTGTGTSADGQSIVLLDEEKFAQICQAFATDRAKVYIDGHAEELRTLDGAPVN